jgi:hypothetical protein
MSATACEACPTKPNRTRYGSDYSELSVKRATGPCYTVYDLNSVNAPNIMPRSLFIREVTIRDRPAESQFDRRNTYWVPAFEPSS